MQMKTFFYPATVKTRYFINGKRVSQEYYQFSQTLAQMKGLVYNSSWGVTRKDGVQVYGCCFN